MSPPDRPLPTHGRISDEAVRAKTGRTWRQWFEALDAAGAREMGHAGIVRHLGEALGVPDWWSQMVAVAYEQERGLREVHQTTRGYQVSVS